MKRREFITLLGTVVAWPLPGRAQQTTKLPTIAYVGQSTSAAEAQRVAAFVERVRGLGWVDGRNFAIDIRWA